MQSIQRISHSIKKEKMPSFYSLCVWILDFKDGEFFKMCLKLTLKTTCVSWKLYVTKEVIILFINAITIIHECYDVFTIKYDKIV